MPILGETSPVLIIDMSGQNFKAEFIRQSNTASQQILRWKGGRQNIPQRPKKVLGGKHIKTYQKSASSHCAHPPNCNSG
jgi:hypothetical protein